MSTQELIDTLRTAADSVKENLPLYMLINMTIDRLIEYSEEIE